MTEENQTNKPRITASQWRLFFIILGVGLASIIFHLLRGAKLDDSAALYVGLPLW